jgi:signal transduction histidine kinase
MGEMGGQLISDIVTSPPYAFRLWALIAVSLVNTTLLLWLGLTIWLNADRPTWGVWLSSGGMLIGSLFFISHTAILGRGITEFSPSINVWWYMGLLAAAVLPFLWYVVMLWYNGYWVSLNSALHRRHRWVLGMSILLLIIVFVLLLVANPFPSYRQVILMIISPAPEIFGIPILILIYGLSVLVNLGGALDALWRPGPARRMMGEQARTRAKPWLLMASVMLLTVTGLIIVVMIGVIWTAYGVRGVRVVGILGMTMVDIQYTIAAFDLLISGCITLAIIFQGQAITQYEVFTGKTLPQRRLARHWRNVLWLSVGYGVVMSTILTYTTHPIYLVIAMTVLMVGGYTWFSRNSYQERERYLNQLRPFLTSQQLYSKLTAATTPAEVDVTQPFDALCANILNTRVAYLAALGPLAPLVGTALSYPHGRPVPMGLALDFRADNKTLLMPVDPQKYGDAHWAVPLWSERGLIGVLLLGEKANDSLYTQEEIEIARASAERLIDTRASAEIARRLMELQRQRLAETNIVDHRTRRMLHDDILPRIHEAMLTMSAMGGQADSAIQVLGNAHREISNLLQEMPIRVAPEIARDGLLDSMRRMINKEFPKAFDVVEWDAVSSVESTLRTLPALTSEVVYYAAREAIRNAAKHGRGDGLTHPFALTITVRCEDGIRITISDNGVGTAATRADKQSKQVQGGNGLALHSTMMAVIGGTLTLDSAVGLGTRVTLWVSA